MKRTIEIGAILTPIPGENPSGEDLRYTQVYEDIKEARRADDTLERGEWQRETKTSDWNKVVDLSAAALAQRTKDIQIAAWLTEGLIQTEGFEGLAAGLNVLVGLLENFWDSVYPPVEEEDLDFRAAPLQFINEKLAPGIKLIPLTETGKTPGYCWLHWSESRDVGLESDTINRSGGVDEGKKKRRDELIAEGRLSAEEFESAVSVSSKGFYDGLAASVTACLESLRRLDGIIDEKFGRQGPSLAEIDKTLTDCAQVVMKIYKEKGGTEAASAPETPEGETARESSEELQREASFQVGGLIDSDAVEKTLWHEAVDIMRSSGIKSALGRVLTACYSAPSARSRTRYRLLMAKLCVEAGRQDLARPIIEELNALIEELHLERWESPLWIAEVLDVLYQCLTRGEHSDEDVQRGQALFQRLCTMDVTKAIGHKH
jgi:type VI secretion system protein ImpA